MEQSGFHWSEQYCTNTTCMNWKVNGQVMDPKVIVGRVIDHTFSIYRENDWMDDGLVNDDQKYVILKHYSWALFAITKYGSIEPSTNSKYWQPFDV